MSKYVWGDEETQFFFDLGPDLVLSAVESLGMETTGRCLTLNSMENRVYEIEIYKTDCEIVSPSERFVIAKFYRPGRWTKEQILEEHQFLLDLVDAEIPVIAPLVINEKTLFELDGHNILYTLFPKKGGRARQEMNEEDLQIMGRNLARIHNVGEISKCSHRIKLTPDSFGRKNLDFLLKKKSIPTHLVHGYQSVVEQLCDQIDPLFKGIKNHRIHGDCHVGNVIWREGEGPYFVDFDDMLIGPAVQDIWMIVPGNDSYAINDRNILVESYESMRDFDWKSIRLIEPLRALRFIHFSAWTANRWEDPTFKLAFPHFGNDHYWEGQIHDLRVQLEIISRQEAQIADDY